MYRYGSNRSPVVELANSPTPRRYQTNREPIKSNFQEGRMLSLILRTTFNRQMKYSMNLIKSNKKRSFHYLKAISRLECNVLRTVFMQIRIFGQGKIIQSGKKRLSQVNPYMIVCKFISNTYYTKLREGFSKLQGCTNFCQSRNQQIQRFSNDYFTVFFRIGGRAGLRKLIAKKYESLSLAIKMQKFTGIVENIQSKVLKQAGQIILSEIFQQKNEQLAEQSKLKKKQIQQCESNRSVILTTERQSLQLLKKTIDSNAVQNYHTIGEMKRGKAIRIGQDKSCIRALLQDVHGLAIEVKHNKKVVEDLVMIQEDRYLLRNISRKGKGAEQKVKQIFLSLNNETDISSPSMRSISSFKYICMVKEKFNHLLTPVSNSEISSFKNSSAFNIFFNVKQRNLLNLFENVPTETLKSSENYQRANHENLHLKELIASLISYQLLSIGGDQKLKADMNELEDQIYQMLEREREEKLEIGSNQKDSMISYTNKSVGNRRKDFGKASTMSIRTTR